MRENATCEDAVNHCDLWATLLEVAGAQPSDERLARINSPGRSYLTQLRGGKSAGAWNVEICEYGNARMIRDDHYKLIRRYPFGGIRFADELYDMRQDPRETVNRMGDRSLAEQVSSLDRQMDAFFERYTVAGRSGLDLEHQPECTAGSPWIVAVEYQKRAATRPQGARAR